ncbi:unnamed protein product [Polarella glacialis]|uniref:PDZ domain-containing protein n=1 Tax=Polarella glacialis TaxID=89957 RepID=A0A813GW62_POLGL|nr:unnamed protein product [Polarella glacialis]CAE8655151.1 unnamed protein product [Polarella glacialis]
MGVQASPLHDFVTDFDLTAAGSQECLEPKHAKVTTLHAARKTDGMASQDAPDGSASQASGNDDVPRQSATSRRSARRSVAGFRHDLLSLIGRAEPQESTNSLDRKAVLSRYQETWSRIQELEDDTGFEFDVHIDRSQGKTGMTCAPDGVCLRVMCIEADGQLAAWNSEHPAHAIQEGDLIYYVNGTFGNGGKLLQILRLKDSVQVEMKVHRNPQDRTERLQLLRALVAPGGDASGCSEGAIWMQSGEPFGLGIVANLPDGASHCELRMEDAEDAATNTIDAYFPEGFLQEGRLSVKVFPGDSLRFAAVRLASPDSILGSIGFLGKTLWESHRWYLASYEVSKLGAFAEDLREHGVPADDAICFKRYLRSCGKRALTEQFWDSADGDSPIFEKYFKGKQVRWSGLLGAAPEVSGTSVRLLITVSKDDLNDGQCVIDFRNPFSMKCLPGELGEWSLDTPLEFIGKLASQGGQSKYVTLDGVKVESTSQPARNSSVPPNL